MQECGIYRGNLKVVQSEKRRLTNEDIKNGKLTAAKERMGKEDGGLARHSVECTRGIDCMGKRTYNRSGK